MEWDCTGTIPAPFLTLNIEYININLIVFKKKEISLDMFIVLWDYNN